MPAQLSKLKSSNKSKSSSTDKPRYLSDNSPKCKEIESHILVNCSHCKEPIIHKIRISKNPINKRSLPKIHCKNCNAMEKKLGLNLYNIRNQTHLNSIIDRIQLQTAKLLENIETNIPIKRSSPKFINGKLEKRSQRRRKNRAI